MGENRVKKGFLIAVIISILLQSGCSEDKAEVVQEDAKLQQELNEVKLENGKLKSENAKLKKKIELMKKEQLEEEKTANR